jgi:hypothetical protein
MDRKSTTRALETSRAPDEQMLVETLLPWWSKLVHRMAVAEEDAGKSKDSGETDNVEDQRVSL